MGLVPVPGYPQPPVCPQAHVHPDILHRQPKEEEEPCAVATHGPPLCQLAPGGASRMSPAGKAPAAGGCCAEVSLQSVAAGPRRKRRPSALALLWELGRRRGLGWGRIKNTPPHPPEKGSPGQMHVWGPRVSPSQLWG